MHADPFTVSVAQLRTRRGNKWSHFEPDVLPAWVADMDFPPAPVVRDALVGAIDRGDLVYFGERLPEVALAWCRWQETHHGWAPEPEHVLVLDDVIGAIRGCLLTWCGAGRGDGAVVQTPVYPPFLSSVADTPARLVENPLAWQHEPQWHIDAAHLATVVDESTRVLLLCNPQNPTGRVFTADELAEVAQVAVDRDLVVVADEIWADLVYEPHRHVPFATLGPEIAARTITLSAPSKTFNLGGLRVAVAHFGSERLQREFTAAAAPYIGQSSALAVEAALAAWRHGEPWMRELLVRLRANRDRVASVLEEHLEEVFTGVPQATYLTWLDFAPFGLADPAAHLLEHGRVALQPGIDFSAACRTFARLNFATTPEILDDVLDRIVRAARTRS